MINKIIQNIIEFFKDNDNKLSATRLISLLTCFCIVVLLIYTTIINKRLEIDFNVVILFSVALTGKVIQKKLES